MIEAQIPKDIRKYESKLAGPFTLRELICFIIGCGMTYVVYKLVSGVASSDIAVTVCIFTALPAVAFGWIKPYGMPLERFLQTVLISNLLAPKRRKYKTRNIYRKAAEPLEKTSKKEYKKRLKKERIMAKTDSKYESFK